VLGRHGCVCSRMIRFWLAVITPRAAEGNVCKSQPRFCGKGLSALNSFWQNACWLLMVGRWSDLLSGQR